MIKNPGATLIYLFGHEYKKRLKNYARIRQRLGKWREIHHEEMQ